MIRSLGLFDAFRPLNILLKDWLDRRWHNEAFRRMICVHEAGHALIAHTLGASPRGMLLCGGPNRYMSYGETFMNPADTCRVSPVAILAILYAGAIAVSVTGAHEGTGCGIGHGAGADYLTSLGIIEIADLEADDIAMVMAYAILETDTRRETLAALANALYENHFLSGDEIDEIIARVA